MELILCPMNSTTLFLTEPSGSRFLKLRYLTLKIAFDPEQTESEFQETIILLSLYKYSEVAHNNLETYTEYKRNIYAFGDILRFDDYINKLTKISHNNTLLLASTLNTKYYS